MTDSTAFADGAAPITVDASLVHLCPPAGSAVAPCCGLTPFELLQTDRLTVDRALVSCAVLAPYRYWELVLGGASRQYVDHLVLASGSGTMVTLCGIRRDDPDLPGIWKPAATHEVCRPCMTAARSASDG